MRGNEMLEDVGITVVLLFMVPIIAISLLVFGIALLYASPLFILGLIIFIVISLKRKDKPNYVMGKIKLIKIPKAVTNVLKTIIKMIFGLLIVAIYLWIMLNIPIGWALIITLSICGYAAGKQLGKGGN